jgi:hypothetical protein
MPKRRSRKGPSGRVAREHRRLAQVQREEAKARETLQALEAAKWPEEVRHLPIDTRRNLPIPFIVEQFGGRKPANFGVLDYRRARFCWERRVCAMCGKRMTGDVALYGDVASIAPDGLFIEAPVHERCIEIAIGGLCPFLHDESWPRRRIIDNDVMMAADREFIHTVGRTQAKRPAVVVTAADYQMVNLVLDDGMMPAYRVPKVKLVRFFTWQDGVAAEAGLEEMADVPLDPI